MRAAPSRKWLRGRLISSPLRGDLVSTKVWNSRNFLRLPARMGKGRSSARNAIILVSSVIQYQSRIGALYSDNRVIIIKYLCFTTKSIIRALLSARYRSIFSSDALREENTNPSSRIHFGFRNAKSSVSFLFECTRFPRGRDGE